MATKNHHSFAAGPSESAHGSHGAIQQMNRDGEALGRDLRVAGHLAAWAEQHPVFVDIALPHNVIDRSTASRRNGNRDRHDRARALPLQRATAQTFDGQMARTQIHSAIDGDDRISTVLSCLFEVVRTYPVVCRRHAISANCPWACSPSPIRRRPPTADFDSCGELRNIAASVSSLTCYRHVRVMPPSAEDPHVQASLAELPARAAESEPVGEDEPELTADDPRADLPDLVLRAVDAEALQVSEAQRIADCYLASSGRHRPPDRHHEGHGRRGCPPEPTRALRGSAAARGARRRLLPGRCLNFLPAGCRTAGCNRTPGDWPVLMHPSTDPRPGVPLCPHFLTSTVPPPRRSTPTRSASPAPGAA